MSFQLPRFLQEALFKLASITGETNNEIATRLIIAGLNELYPNSINLDFLKDKH